MVVAGSSGQIRQAVILAGGQAARLPRQLPYWIKGGIYVFESDVVAMLPERRVLAAYTIDGYWRGVDTAKDVKEAGEEITQLGW